VFLGLVLGKPLGVIAASWASVRSGLARRPSDVGWLHLLGVGATAGIGFTVALFVAELAFGDRPALLEQAKVAILVGSAVSLAVGQVVLRLAPRASSGGSSAGPSPS
jgi:NhaA family Na+:H+ antiporter